MELPGPSTAKKVALDCLDSWHFSWPGAQVIQRHLVGVADSSAQLSRNLSVADRSLQSAQRRVWAMALPRPGTESLVYLDVLATPGSSFSPGPRKSRNTKAMWRVSKPDARSQASLESHGPTL